MGQRRQEEPRAAHKGGPLQVGQGLESLAPAVQEIAGQRGQDDGRPVADHVPVPEGGEVLAERPRRVHGQQPHGGHQEHRVAEPAELARAEPERQPHEGNRFDAPRRAHPLSVQLYRDRQGGERHRQRRPVPDHLARRFCPDPAEGDQEHVERRQRRREPSHPGAVLVVHEPVADEQVRDRVRGQEREVDDARCLPSHDMKRKGGSCKDEEDPGDTDLREGGRRFESLQPEREEDQRPGPGQQGEPAPVAEARQCQHAHIQQQHVGQQQPLVGQPLLQQQGRGEPSEDGQHGEAHRLLPQRLQHARQRDQGEQAEGDDGR